MGLGIREGRTLREQSKVCNACTQGVTANVNSSILLGPQVAVGFGRECCYPTFLSSSSLPLLIVVLVNYVELKKACCWLIQIFGRMQIVKEKIVPQWETHCRAWVQR